VADSWFNRGVETGRQLRYGEAIEWLAACRAARPGDVECLRALAKVWCCLGLPDEALRCVNEAIALSPGDSSSLFLKAYVERKRKLVQGGGHQFGVSAATAGPGVDKDEKAETMANNS